MEDFGKVCIKLSMVTWKKALFFSSFVKIVLAEKAAIDSIVHDPLSVFSRVPNAIYKSNNTLSEECNPVKCPSSTLLAYAFLRLPPFLPADPVATPVSLSPLTAAASTAEAFASISSMAGLYAVSTSADVGAGCAGADVVADATRFGSAWPITGTAVANTVWKGAAMNEPALSNHSEKGREKAIFFGAVLALGDVTVISTL